MRDKKDMLLAVLGRSWAWLHVDGTAAGVDLPDWVRMPWVKLQIGYDMPLPIPDLAIDDAGVRATLSFRRAPHTCLLPWASIFAISDVELRGAIFDADVPSGIRELVLMELRLAPAPAGADGDAMPSQPAPIARLRSGKPRPSHLKLV